jgi:hypothetical protein
MRAINGLEMWLVRGNEMNFLVDSLTLKSEGFKD